MSATHTQFKSRTGTKPNLYKLWRIGYQAGGDDYVGESAGGCVRWRRLWWRFYWRRSAPKSRGLSIPEGVTLSAHRPSWGDDSGWFPVTVKGDETLCFADGKGLVIESDMIAVEGRELNADRFADRLRELGYRFVWVGDPEGAVG